MREIEIACQVCFNDEDEKAVREKVIRKDPPHKMTGEQIKTVVDNLWCK